MQSIVVHGAGGFVGSHLVDLLKPLASSLLLTDSRPTDDWSSARQGEFSNIAAISTNTIRDSRIGPVETAIVLAGQSDVDEALRDPENAIATNIMIAVDCAEWARANPTSRLIYMSSDEVLGVSTEERTETSPLAPTQPYAASKAAAELILTTYAECYDVNILILRSCNLIGSHHRAAKLIPVAANCLINRQPIPLYGDGHHMREWMAVEDLCDAIVLLTDRRIQPGIYQAGSGVRLSTLEVIKIISEALQIPPSFRHDRDRLVNDRSYAMDSSKLRAAGWVPRRQPGDCIRAAARSRRADVLRERSL